MIDHFATSLRGMTEAKAPQRSTLLRPTSRTTLKRHAERGGHDRAAIDAILDEALVCHVAVLVDGAPRSLPTAHVRVGDVVYLHGARANRFLAAALSGSEICLTVTLVDGLVFARTWMHHSMNFRSAMLFGRPIEVTDPAEKLRALAALVDHAASGRSAETRAPTDAELRSTLVVKLPIVEASAKVRTGPPLDTPDTLDDDCWAGELPLSLRAFPAQSDPRLRTGIRMSLAVSTRATSLAVDGTPVYEVRRGDHLVSTDPARLDFPLIHRFLSEESYWARGVEEDVQRRAIEQSLSFGLYDERGAQIGFARVVTDGGRLAYVADVFVLGHARRQGLGAWLVASVLEHPALTNVDTWLLGTLDAHPFYERFGFVTAESERYMVRKRRA